MPLLSPIPSTWRLHTDPPLPMREGVGRERERTRDERASQILFLSSRHHSPFRRCTGTRSWRTSKRGNVSAPGKRNGGTVKRSMERVGEKEEQRKTTEKACWTLPLLRWHHIGHRTGRSTVKENEWGNDEARTGTNVAIPPLFSPGKESRRRTATQGRVARGRPRASESGHTGGRDR